MENHVKFILQKELRTFLVIIISIFYVIFYGRSCKQLTRNNSSFVIRFLEKRIKLRYYQNSHIFPNFFIFHKQELKLEITKKIFSGFPPRLFTSKTIIHISSRSANSLRQRFPHKSFLLIYESLPRIQMAKFQSLLNFSKLLLSYCAPWIHEEIINMPRNTFNNIWENWILLFLTNPWLF